MKTQEKKELQTKTVLELQKLLKDAEDMLLSLKLEKEQARLKNTRTLFWKRKEIAIIKTLMNMKKKEETK